MAIHGSGATGVIRVLREQLELLKGEVDQVIAKLDGGLEIIGLEEINNSKQAKIAVVKPIHLARAKPSKKLPFVDQGPKPLDQTQLELNR
jgi:hypothetical protein